MSPLFLYLSIIKYYSLKIYNMGSQKSNISLESICKSIAERLGPCPKCGVVPCVIAVFENNKSNKLVGFKILCNCNAPNEKISQEELATLPVYTLDDLSKKLNKQ